MKNHSYRSSAELPIVPCVTGMQVYIIIIFTLINGLYLTSMNNFVPRHSTLLLQITNVELFDDIVYL